MLLAGCVCQQTATMSGYTFMPRAVTFPDAPKKYVPNNKQGDVCPNGVPALVEGGNNDSDSDSE